MVRKWLHRTRRERNQYLWLLGQDDNIGDIVLRRRNLQSALLRGRCHVYVGNASFEYVAGILGDDETRVKVYRRSWAWILGLAKNLPLGTADLWLPPGEIRANAAMGRWYLLMVPVILLVRATGGVVLNIGAGLHHNISAWLLPIKTAAALSTRSTWRDALSRDMTRVGDVGPDWAYDTGTNGVSGERNILALSWRADALGDDFSRLLDAIGQVSEQEDLVPTVIVQVRRDANSMREIARSRGWQLLDWSQETTAEEQEEKIRDVLCHSRAVLSDRIHVLIVGSSEGAQPIGLMNHTDEKVSRHLVAAGIRGQSLNASAVSTKDIREWVLQRIRGDGAWRIAHDRARLTIRMIDNSLESV